MNITTVGAEKKEELIVNSENHKDENVNSRDPEKHEDLDSAKMRKDLQDTQWTEMLNRRDEAIRQTMRDKYIKVGMSTKGVHDALVKIDDTLKALREEIHSGTGVYNWKNLEVGRRFTTDDKIGLVDEQTLIVGADIGKNEHHIRAFNKSKKELKRKDILRFDNREEGLEKALVWIEEKRVEYGFTKVILGCEPTGHYWFDAALYFEHNGITVVLVNPNAVNKSKELDDNSQEKDDRKDPSVIAKLVIDGRYSVPYLPEGNYAALREIEKLRIWYMEERTMCINRLHRFTDIHFPEIDDVTQSSEGKTNQLILLNAPLPEDLIALGIEGIQQLFRKNKLRGIGRKLAKRYYDAAVKSIGVTACPEMARIEARYLVEDIQKYDERIADLEERYAEYGVKIPNMEKVLEIKGIGIASLCDALAEIGDISRFEDASQIFKLAGFVPVHQSSGKHIGEFKISKRGRKHLRKALWILARNVSTQNDEWRQLYNYYLTRENNPLTGYQAYVAIAGKLLRVIFAILRKGYTYDPQKLLSEVKRVQTKPEEEAKIA